jgi:hypothetical protein
MCIGRGSGMWRGSKKVVAVGMVVLTVTLLWVWSSYSTRQSTMRAQRARSLKALYVALWCYADKHGGFPWSCTTDRAGKPTQSWRVLLLPFLGDESLFSRIDLNDRWDSSANRPLGEMMPKYYRSPAEAETLGTTTNYFAVSEAYSPGKIGSLDEIMLVEVIGSKTPWMKPWDPTIEQLLDMLRPAPGNSADAMYITAGGDVQTVDPKIDRESLRKLFSRSRRG